MVVRVTNHAVAIVPSILSERCVRTIARTLAMSMEAQTRSSLVGRALPWQVRTVFSLSSDHLTLNLERRTSQLRRRPMERLTSQVKNARRLVRYVLKLNVVMEMALMLSPSAGRISIGRTLPKTTAMSRHASSSDRKSTERQKYGIIGLPLAHPTHSDHQGGDGGNSDSSSSESGSDESELGSDSDDSDSDGIELVLRKHGGRLKLKKQRPRVRRVAKQAIEDMLINVCTVNAYPDGPDKTNEFAQSSLRRSAKALGDTDIARRLKHDDKYWKKLATIVSSNYRLYSLFD